MKTDAAAESGLWSAYRKNRTVENRNKLVVFYTPYVKIVIGKLAARHNKYIDYDDLFSCGTLGLIDAVEKFSDEKGVKFETYAAIRIRGKILDHLRRQDILPSSLRQKIKKVEAAFEKLEASMQRPVSAKEVADSLGYKEGEVKQLLELSHMANVVNIDDTIAFMLSNRRSVKTEYEPEYNYERKAVKSALTNALGTLNEKEKIIVSLYYYENLTLKEIGSVLGISESRVCQLHSKILTKLKNRLGEEAMVI